MNILIAIGHPAQVHNFRIVSDQLKRKGHEVFWLASKKDISDYLLKAYNIDYTELKRPHGGVVSKVSTLIKNVWITIRVIRRNNIDIVVSRVNPGVVLASFLLRKKQIGLSDTEVAGFYDLAFSKFLNSFITSTSFEKTLRKDQIRINANIELFYLHPNYFKGNKDEVFRLLNIPEKEPFVIVRYVSNNAYHDLGTKFISNDKKIEFVKQVSKYARVFISSEEKLPVSLQKYEIKFPYEKVHEVMKEAMLFYGESATMASECAIMGVPAIYVNAQSRGYTNDEQRYGLLYYYKTDEKSQLLSINKAIELLNKGNLKEEMRLRQRDFMKSKIDPVAFLVWFIENYPESKRIMKENPDYQYNFR